MHKASLLKKPSFKPATFLLVSLILHVILISIINYLFSRTELNDESPDNLTINLKITQVLSSSNKQYLSNHPPSSEQMNIPSKGQKGELWNKGIEALRKLMLQPEFLEQLYEKENFPTEQKSNLFDQKRLVTQTTIESFKNLASGEVGVTFRYPSGKTICARIRQPNPLDSFDIGSWLVLLNGCN